MIQFSPPLQSKYGKGFTLEIQAKPSLAQEAKAVIESQFPTASILVGHGTYQNSHSIFAGRVWNTYSIRNSERGKEG